MPVIMGDATKIKIQDIPLVSCFSNGDLDPKSMNCELFQCMLILNTLRSFFKISIDFLILVTVALTLTREPETRIHRDMLDLNP